MAMCTLSKHQVRLLLFQFYDDQITNPGSDIILTARTLRVIEDISEVGVLMNVLEEEKQKGRLEILAGHREADTDVPCVRLLDYVTLSAP